MPVPIAIGRPNQENVLFAQKKYTGEMPEWPKGLVC